MMRFWSLLLSCFLIVASGLGLLVLAGGAKHLAAPPLEAQLDVQAFPVPEGFGIDPARVAGYMADKLVQRMDGDVAMRMTLDSENMKKVKEIVLPRLMSVVPVQEMMRDIPELSAILELGSFRGSVTGRITSAEAARDVALTVPDARLAEVDGEKFEITTTSTGMTALVLGDMAAGEVREVTVWIGEEGMNSDLARTIRVGADAGLRGRVLLWGEDEWFGADVEALRWSRWLIGAVLGGVLLFGVASLILPFLTARQARSGRSALDASGR
jgi:hypothetical protein